MLEKPDHKPTETTPRAQPRSLPIATAGIRTGQDFARMMSALMSDVIEGSINPSVCNSAANAGGKLLRIVELQLKYGSPAAGGVRELILCPPEAADPASSLREQAKAELEQIEAVRAQLLAREQELQQGMKS